MVLSPITFLVIGIVGVIILVFVGISFIKISRSNVGIKIYGGLVLVVSVCLYIWGIKMYCNIRNVRNAELQITEATEIEATAEANIIIEIDGTRYIIVDDKAYEIV